MRASKILCLKIDKVLFFCVILLKINLVECQSNSLLNASQINFKNISREEELPRSKVYGISQDSTGYIWIASLNGLNKYDGKEFKTYYLPINNASDDLINDQKIYTDRDSKIWFFVGDEVDSNLRYYDKILDFFITVPNINRIKCMVQHTNGAIYLWTVGNGILKIDFKSSDTIQLLKGEQISNQINRITEYKNNIYATAKGKFFKIDNNDSVFEIKQLVLITHF